MPRDHVKFHMLDVGQGNCCVWASPETDIIIDANIPSAGEGTYVKGYLKDVAHVSSPVTRFILTGWDDDHANPEGVGMVTKNYTVQKAWIPQWPNKTDAADDVKRLLKEARWLDKYDVYHPRTDSQREFKIGDTAITLFSPHPADANSANNCSIVARLSLGNFSVLITGDCEGTRWDSIVKYFPGELRADVLVVPHHGSKNGITEAALKHIRPTIALISAGDHKVWKHPHKETLTLLAKYAKAVRVTKTHGSICVRPKDDQTLSVESDRTPNSRG